MCRHVTCAEQSAATPPLADQCESQVGRRLPWQPFDAHRCPSRAAQREVYERISRRAAAADSVLEHDVCAEHFGRGEAFHYACGLRGPRPMEV
jgi:hypothetical protein